MSRLDRILIASLTTGILVGSLLADETIVFGRRGMVVSAHPLASQVGMRVLAQGGNAVDAAVSMAITLGVVEFEMSGLGGVGNMLIHWNGGPSPEVLSLDYRDVIASKARIDRYDQQNKEVGMLATCVPGNVAGWAAALERFGTISWKEALSPAIDYAENGFPLRAREAHFIEVNKEHILRFPTTARVFLPDGQTPRPGHLFVQKDLARTLRRIANEGPEVFYKGKLADEFVAFSDRNGGVFTKSDFSNYEVLWRKPVRTTYREYEIVSASAPNFGPAIVETFNIMEGFDLPSMSPGSAPFVHTIAESLKLAAADGMRYIGDPRFVDMPLERLLSKEHADSIRSQIRPDRASYGGGGAQGARDDHTTTFQVVDSKGNVVSSIQTLISAMGSKVVFGNTGVLFNNNMRKVRSEGPNSLEPGKTFGTPSAPTLVLKDGKPFVAIGGVGGPDIWQAIVVVLAKILDGKLDLHQAIASPRFTIRYGFMAVTDGLARDSQFQYRQINIESGASAGLQRDLEALGHEVVNGPAGNVHAILIDQERGVLEGVGDPRIKARAVGW